jgi:hypothetical protein
MQATAVGFRAHSGWTALVALSLTKGSPTVLDRRRIELVKTFTYTYRQPYHTAKGMSLKEAENFIACCQDEARGLASSAIRTLQKELDRVDCKLVRCGLLLASGRPLPGLEQILASHALIHTADGELFRNAIVHASKRCRIHVQAVKERELLDRASKSLGMRPDALKNRIAELGRSFGPPWGQDEKFSALAAWLALVA